MTMHETPEQKIYERKFATALAERFGGRVCELPYTYGLDWMWEHDQLRFLEYKKINYSSTDLKEFMCSLYKLERANVLFDTTGRKSFLIVHCTDGVFVAPITHLILNEDYRINFWGREDRHYEPQAMIPIDAFKDIKDVFRE